jgi:diaminohydroxyphosphoribosylaminopyrimidine deaminase/5-amino-6-(5-phosphoribosylamino)uracil reductase
LTTIVAGKSAPKNRVAALAENVNVIRAPFRRGSTGIDLRWLLRNLGEKGVTSLLVEGGGEVNASFLMGGFAQRIAFFYAPKILGGRDSRKAVAGEGAKTLKEVLGLKDLQIQWLGPDLLLTARVES